MTVLLGVVAVVVVLLGTAWAMKRRRSDDAHSVEGYRQTLQTLEGLGARPAPPPARAPAPPPARASAPAPAPASPRASPRALARPETGTGIAPLPRSGNGRSSWSADRRSRRPLLLAALVPVVVAVAVVIALTGHPAPRGTAGTAGSASHPSSTGASHARHRDHHQAPTATTATTVPLRYEPVTSTASSATYAPPTATYAVTLAATTGACWVQATSASGATVLAVTVAAGTSQKVTLSGQVTVQIGAPSVMQVSVDRAPVVLPAGYRGPFTMTFTPPGAVGGSPPAAAGS